MMKTSPRGRKFIRDQEGSVDHLYYDQTGHPTIGVGHVIKEHEHFPYRLTPEYIDKILEYDLEEVEKAVNSYCAGLDLTQNEFDVLVDFAFNEGVGGFHQLMSYGIDQVPDRLPDWIYSKGQVIDALVKRRQAEVEMWNELPDKDVAGPDDGQAIVGEVLPAVGDSGPGPSDAGDDSDTPAPSGGGVEDSGGDPGGTGGSTVPGLLQKVWQWLAGHKHRGGK